MARIFEIVPYQIITHDGGSVQNYSIGEDAEQAFDLILEPYGQSGIWYLEKIKVERPPWAFVALRREYDIATYITAQRNKIDTRGPRYSFGFSPYKYDPNQTPPIKVACFGFFSKNMVAAAAEKIQFLRPAWALLQDKAVKQNWLVLLDEEPTDVMSEAASTRGEKLQCAEQQRFGSVRNGTF
jgi:hypothetical protein